MNTETMISAQNICKGFGGVPVLRGVSLELARGEVVAVIGPSGSGKSTFLRCLNHLETIDSGRVAVEGEVLVDSGADGRAHYVPEAQIRSEEHTSELQSQSNLVCRLLLEKKKKNRNDRRVPHRA